MRKHISLFSKISTLTILVSISLIVTLSLVFININKKTLTLNIKNYYLSILDDISNSITRNYDTIVNDLTAYVSLLNSENLAAKDKINLISLEISRSEQIDFVIIYEADGNPLDIFMPKDMELPFIETPPLTAEVREKLLASDVYIETPNRCFNDLDYYSNIVVPWYLNNELQGYLATCYNLEQIRQQIEATSLKRFNKTDRVYLLNFYGQTISGPRRDNLYIISKNLFLFEDSFYKFMETAGSNIAISKTYKRDNEPVLTSYIINSNLKFIIGVEQPQSVAFSSIRKLQKAALTTAGISVVIVLIISLLFSRLLSDPIKRLSQLITQLTRNKNFGETIEVKSNDEIFDLAENFNKLSIELDGYEKTIQADTVIKHNLARFLSPQVVERITSRNMEASLLNEERTIAVMFADIHRFTSLSEKMAPPDVINLLNTFFSRCVENIYLNHGMVDKFIGDCIMAIFNAPYDIENPALAAVRSALAIRKIIAEIAAEFQPILQAAEVNSLSVGIAVAYGKAIVGTLGAEERTDYTAIGDTVNVSFHLQGLAKGENEILINQLCYEKVKDHFLCEYYQAFSLKSRNKKCETYRVLKEK